MRYICTIQLIAVQCGISEVFSHLIHVHTLLITADSVTFLIIIIIIIIISQSYKLLADVNRYLD